MRIPVLKGREFTQQDSVTAPGAIIVNHSLASKYFPGEDPVGKRITIGGYDDAWGEIVGVVGDVRQWSMGAEPEPASFALTRFLERLLFGVEPTDPWTFAVVSLVLTAVALLACYVPARRAARLDPLTALHYE
jgi:hypothetical protein